MKKYFGNYLGLVVDDRDPQNRGRTKVFIPHIMPALYENWNAEGKDISFNITDGGLPTGLSPDIVDRLQKVLPWAECAAPIFGAGPAGKYDYSAGTLNAVVQNVSNSKFEKQGAGAETMPLGSLPTADSPESKSRAANAIQKGLLGTKGMCARGANNILSYYINGEGMATSGANARDMGPVLETRYNMSVVTDTGVYQNGDTRILTGPGSTQHIETYMNGGWYSDFAQNNSSVNNPRYNTAKLYRLPTSTIDLANGNAPEVNPSVDPPAKQDANTKPDLTAETGTVQDSGTASISLLVDENGQVSASQLETEILKQIKSNPNSIYNNGKIPKNGEAYGLDGTPESWAKFYTQLAGHESAYYNLPFKNDINGVPEPGGSGGLFQLGRDQIEIWRDARDAKPGLAESYGFQQGVNYTEQQYLDPSFNATGMLFIGEALLNENFAVGPGEGLGRTIGRLSWDKIAAGTNPGSGATNPTLAATSVAASQPTIQHTTPVPSIGGPNTNYMPTGMFGSARAGQTVWVFFQEGNPLFPVYFAAAYGANEWANINQASSPDPIKNIKDPIQGVQSNLSLDGGGIASKQIISGQPSGFEKDEFVFQVYGKNGSALTFTFLATLLNSKYDFKQHTQGDAHYITGGNRTDRTTGDHNIVCEQDLIITVGNWSQEALDAASEIQNVVTDAMKAAKDTYEA
jgi:hypothetical protein